MSVSTVQVTLPDRMEAVVNPYPPMPFQSLIFYGQNPIAMSREGTGGFIQQPTAVLVGPQYSRVNIRVMRQLNAIRVDFLPGALHRLLALPMNELFDGGFDATDFFGSRFRTLCAQLEADPDLEQGVRRVEAFLLERLHTLKARQPLDQALCIMLAQGGQLRLESVASMACLSIRQFERRFRECVGMNPKLYARIIRFSQAYRMREAEPALSWTAIAHAAGYFDQMHMIRDFRVFAGVNPTVIARELAATPLRMQRDLFS